MVSFLLEDRPGDQLLMGAFFLLAGLVIFPAMLSFALPLVKWMNAAWAEADWWKTGWTITKGIMLFACSWFVILGAGRLAIYSFVKAGLMESPWS